MGIRTSDVLAAASTKWNFLPFKPGLVGGHCIGVDPYYLTTKAQELGYQPEVILAGRRINNTMGPYLAQRLVKMLVNADIPVKGARVGILGVTFKENCNDLRNSKVPDIVSELRQFGIHPFIHDPVASPARGQGGVRPLASAAPRLPRPRCPHPRRRSRRVRGDGGRSASVRACAKGVRGPRRREERHRSFQVVSKAPLLELVSLRSRPGWAEADPADGCSSTAFASPLRRARVALGR